MDELNTIWEDGMTRRLIIHVDSISQSDINTFEAAAIQLKKEYKLKYSKDSIEVFFVKSGKGIVDILDKEKNGSVVSLDIVSHGNQGGIHISRKLAKPVESGFLQKRAHVKIRASSSKPQSTEEAEMIEESMHGLYSGWAAQKGVSYYYNQSADSSTDISYLDSVKFAIFSEGAFIEFHGCRTAEHIPALNSFIHDNFAKQFSEMAPKNCIVVGHITNSNPNKSKTNTNSDYRHGNIRSYQNGKVVNDVVERSSLKFKNSSTP